MGAAVVAGDKLGIAIGVPLGDAVVAGDNAGVNVGTFVVVVDKLGTSVRSLANSLRAEVEEME